MSGTPNLSPLLGDSAWQALSRQLSVRARIAIFYLDELWKDEQFQRDWTRLKEAYLAKKSANEFSSRFFGEWKQKLPFLLRAAFVDYLFAKLVNEDSDAVEYLMVFFGEEQFRLTVRQLAERLFVGELGELRLRIYLEDRNSRWVISQESMFDAPPIFLLIPLIPPLPEESKREYLKRVKNDLEYELELLAQPCIGNPPIILSLFMERLGYEFHNPRNAIPAILALAEDYYEKCAAEQCLQVSNLNDETLARYAQQAYLRVVKGETWGKIMSEVFKKEVDDIFKRFNAGEIDKNEKDDRIEALRQRVIRSTGRGLPSS
jgi:hypothetical protein